MATQKAILKLTDAAADRIKAIMAQADPDKPVHGVRVNVRARGCSGKSYQLEYATEINAKDEVVEEKGVRVYVDPAAVLYLIGTVMDYTEGDLESGFNFHNPNEKGRCGCGESFHV